MAAVETLQQVVIRFAGDSGDGMQLTGNRFSSDAAAAGNDIATLPNFPAEIRAPQGTVPGVSSYQVQFASFNIATPGDRPDVLVAMNPAALKANLKDLERGALIIVDTADFTARNLKKVGYADNPLTDGTLDSYRVIELDLTGLTLQAVEDFKLGRKQGSRAKNMYALGVLSWLYSRPVAHSEQFIAERFAKDATLRDSNLAAFRAGYNYAETVEIFQTRYQILAADLPPGRYRLLSGNQATALGLIAGAKSCGLQLFLGSYPITPASDILHLLASQKAYGVITFQAEDEIAGASSAIGASLAGALGVTTTSGPGFSLKSESIGLGVMLEVPLVVIDVQRAGPSTGMPTKTEQADLLQAMFGRHGESPVGVIAAQSPADCFRTAFEACQLAVKYRTPVIMLSDGYLANGAEPWLIPNVDELPKLDPGYATGPNDVGSDGTPIFKPYKRNPDTLARDMAIPGTPGLEHRLGGLEKDAQTSGISIDPDNHELMVHTRQEKIDRMVADIDLVTVDDPSGAAKVLVLGWGSTYGPIFEATRQVRETGRPLASTHLRNLNPLPANLGEVLKAYPKVVLPEMNLGQLALMLRAKYLVDIQSFSRVRGLPISSGELFEYLCDCIDQTTKHLESE